MNLYKRIEAILIGHGLLTTNQLKWERISGVWLFCTVGAVLLLCVVVILDIVLLDGLLQPVLRVLGIILFGSFIGAVVLVAAATHHWIL